jgi:hypothetical protein
VEAYQVNVLASAMSGNLEQVQDSKKSRLAGELWGDLGKPDRFDRLHFDLAFVHVVPAACFYARAQPDSDRSGDLSASNSLAKPFGKHHIENLLQGVLPAAL